MAFKTPLGWAAERWELGPRALVWSTTSALVVAIFIVLGGGVVRVTGSGLGCPTWPSCSADSLTAIPALGFHSYIEFGNRLVTLLLVVAVGWAIIAARLQRPRDRALTRLAWSMFWLVVANAVAGGITVLVKLNPWVVAFHFLLSVGLLATATLTWHRARAHVAGERPERAPRADRRRAWALLALTLLLIMVGTVVSGAGPHSGDTAEVSRIRIDWTTLTVIHGVLGSAVLLLGVWHLAALRQQPGLALAARRTTFFVVVVVAQAALGLVQSLTGIPSALVAIHLLGSAVVWVGAIRVLLDTDTALFALRAPAAASAPANALA